MFTTYQLLVLLVVHQDTEQSRVSYSEVVKVYTRVCVYIQTHNKFTLWIQKSPWGLMCQKRQQLPITTNGYILKTGDSIGNSHITHVLMGLVTLGLKSSVGKNKVWEQLRNPYVQIAEINEVSSWQDA